MTTFAFFALQMISFFCLFVSTYLFSPFVLILFATYLMLVPSPESSLDKYVSYFSAIFVKHKQWIEMN